MEPLLRLLKAVMIVWTATWLQPKEQCSVSEQSELDLLDLGLANILVDRRDGGGQPCEEAIILSHMEQAVLSTGNI